MTAPDHQVIDPRISQAELHEIFRYGIPLAAITWLFECSPDLPLDEARERLKWMALCYRQGYQTGQHNVAESLDALAHRIRSAPP